jgi:hypothetical protein
MEMGGYFVAAGKWSQGGRLWKGKNTHFDLRMNVCIGFVGGLVLVCTCKLKS